MNRELLTELMYAHGVSGREKEIANTISKIISPYVDTVETDKAGNVIAHKRGNGKRLLFIASMDTVGFYADYITEDGKVRISGVRGIDYKSIVGTEVVSQNGVIGTIFADEGADELDYDTVYVNIGAKDRCEAEEKIRVTESLAIRPRLIKVKSTEYLGTPFDNRVSCYALIEAIKRIEKSEYDLYFAFTTQHKDLHYGSRNAVYSVEPDYVISLGVSRDKEIGKGIAVKIKDLSTPASREVVDMILDSATKSGIVPQYEIDDKKSSDLGLLRTIKSGSQVGAILVPCQSNGTTNERIDFKDIEEMILVISEIIKG